MSFTKYFEDNCDAIFERFSIKEDYEFGTYLTDITEERTKKESSCTEEETRYF